MPNQGQIVRLTTDIVSAFVGKNAVSPADLPSLISVTHSALSGAQHPAEPKPEARAPAAPIKRSVQPDFIVCLEDGRKFQTLRRHLQSSHGLSPEAYRAKWGLPLDYPMAAETLKASRSQVAKQMGLGHGDRRGSRAATAEPPPQAAPEAPEEGISGNDSVDS